MTSARPPATLRALLIPLTAALGALIAASWLTERARSWAARWRRPEPRHARPERPSHPRPYMPGIGHLDVPLDVVRAPFPPSMPRKPCESTLVDFEYQPDMWRPYINPQQRDGECVA